MIKRLCVRRYCDPSCLFVHSGIRSARSGPSKTNSWVRLCGAEFLQNGWRFRLAYNGAPIENGISGESDGHVPDDVS